MKLNRNKLRKLLLQESRQIMAEMDIRSMMGASPENDEEYNFTAQIIQQCVMSCINQQRCDHSQVFSMCQQMCSSYGIPHLAAYCADKVVFHCQKMGL
tara:strand:+ start:96 stop:389 length:294 start_codon:yes stop_codon:yes gene_type:complete